MAPRAVFMICNKNQFLDSNKSSTENFEARVARDSRARFSLTADYAIGEVLDSSLEASPLPAV